MASSNPNPPPYTATIRTVHDETHRGVWHQEPCIQSMGQVPHLLAYLEHHQPTTDGSFSICIAGGEGVFISQELYDSIPAEYRPVLNTVDAGRSIGTLFGKASAVGTTYLPFILTDDRGQKVRIVLHTYIVPYLATGMFLSMVPTTFDLETRFGNPPVFTAKF